MTVDSVTEDVSLTDTDLGFFQQELFWVDHYDYLEREGYRLRRRYKPGVLREWISDFRAGKPLRESWQSIEDVSTRPADGRMVAAGIEATRIEDGAYVFIKCLTSGANDGLEYELELNQMLVKPPLQSPRNHCAPLLHFFMTRTATDRYRFLVFPFLRRLRLTPFRLAVELVEFSRQLLEGVAFLHENGIAHRDLHRGNIAMETSAMWGPNAPRSLRSATSQFDVSEQRPIHDRIDVPVKYFLLDLGLSSRFQPNQSQLVHFEGGVCIPPESFDTEIPLALDAVLDIMHRLQADSQYPAGSPQPTRAYDAFQADIFQAGVLLKEVLAGSVPSLNPLLDMMTVVDPARRPTAAQCVELHSSLTEHLSQLDRIRPAKNVSVEGGYSGVWGLFFSSRAFIRHWLEWIRLAIKYSIRYRGAKVPTTL